MPPSYVNLDGFPPVLSPAAYLVYSLLYVGVIYLSPTTGPRPGLNRNSPLVIQAWAHGTIIVRMVCTLATSALVFFKTCNGWWDTLSSMGLAHIAPRTVLDIIRALLLTAILFVSPLGERLALRIVTGEDADDDVVLSGRLDWIRWRNYAPLAEEIVFRSCMVPLQLIGGISLTTIVFTTPLVFGIAHFHHGYEFLLNCPGYWKLAALYSTAQFIYTTIFGWYAGSIWPVVAAHAFCNCLGAPSLRVAGPKWLSFGYWGLLVGGCWGFFKLLWPLTESAYPLASFI